MVEPGIMLENPHGLIVQVVVSRVENLLKIGFKKLQPGYKKNTIQNKKILVYRSFGGWGDMLCILPAIKQLSKLYTFSEIVLGIPDRYHFIFHGIDNLVLLDFKQIGKVDEFGKNFEYVVNL
ncbi:hypothetical protein KAR91_76185, partial [Candidatus Pacearchaeota archaeon]|nr:hypothetical protein [Candidatus Pacearchaeota archaeon]